MKRSNFHWLVLVPCLLVLGACSSEHEQEDSAAGSAEVLETGSGLVEEPGQGGSGASRMLSTLVQPEAGEYFIYTYRKTKYQTGKPGADESSRVRIDVLDADESGTTLQWHVLLDMPPEEDQSAIARLIRESDMKLKVRVDPTWEQVVIPDFDPVHEHLLRITDLTGEVKAPSMPAETREQTQAAIRGMFEDRDFAYAALLKPVSLFLFPMGWEGAEGETRVIESELANPLQGPPLPAVLEVTLLRGDEPGQTQWVYNQRFAKEKASAFVMSVMDEMVSRLGVEGVNEDSSDWELDIRDSATGVVDAELGFIERMKFERFFAMTVDGEQQGNRVETWSWILDEHGVVSSGDQSIDD